ncbi:uncharacterized protein LOC129921411 [Episyrphus balteatus]|uniref:uncharacterized protein LOC129921411 n=1 Tax=Episyrphus balteatus TaxID=286459 RepID=UPI002485E9C1|nr:uncharacterized protein LOC129921411 [Episyrphus balteatus]
MSPGTTTQPDQRGCGASNTTNPQIENEIREHIKSFPAYESHYTRRDSSCKYFHSDLTLSKMYRLYCEKHQSVASISTYSKIFKTMNIKFKKPKLDTCHRCEILKTKLEIGAEDEDAKSQLLKEQEEHHKLADLAYKSKSKDKDTGRNDNSIKVYTFDLQQCLPTPFLRTNISFYKRQLWTYNLTLHDCVTNQAYCYMWDESVANRGVTAVRVKTKMDTLQQCFKYLARTQAFP